VRRRALTSVPGARDTNRGHAAGVAQHAQRPADLSGARAAGNGEDQSWQPAGVEHIHVEVHVQRAVRQVRLGQVGDLAAPDRRAGQVLDLGRIQVPGAGQHDPVFRHRAEPECVSDQFGPVSG